MDTKDKATKRKAKRDGLFQRGGTWYFRRMVNGQRVTVTTGCKDRRQAERRRTELDKDMNDEKFGWKAAPKAAVPTIEDYLETTAPVYAKQKTGGVRARHMLTRLSQAFRDRRMDTITTTDCQGFLHSREVFGKAAPNSVRTEHIVFKAFWNRAIGDHLVTENPWRFKMPREVPRGRVMSYDEQVLLFPALSPSVRRAVTVAVYTGLRNYELCHIERGDVDYVRELIHVRSEVAKLGKARIVPMPTEAADAIREQLAAFDHGDLRRMFTRVPDDDLRLFPYAPTSLIHLFSAAVRAAKVPSLTIHDLRRTFGTRCAEGGVPMRVLQKWLGHSTITMTERFYSNVNELRLDHLGPMLDATRKALAVPPTVTNLVAVGKKS